MEELYRAHTGGLQAHIDDAAFRLLSLDLPNWYINFDIKFAFTDRQAWDSVVESSPLQVAPGLDSVLSSEGAPTIDFFKKLPSPSKTSKQWGVYVLVLERPGFPPMLYIGSGTNAADSIRVRIRGYLNGYGHCPELVKQALDQGYKISSIGILCWVDLPPPHLVARIRARILVLEAVFTIIFCACRKTIMDDAFIPDFFPWQRTDVGWQPACTHISLSEGIGADLKLTDEELNNAAAARYQRSLARSVVRTASYRKRKRDADEEGYMQDRREKQNDYGARNRGKVNELAAGARKRAKDAERFRCDICNQNEATQHNLDLHNNSYAHLEAVRLGGKVVKPPSAGSIAVAERRAAHQANRRFYCKPCDKACTSPSDLKRHNSKQKHIKAVAAAEEAAANAIAAAAAP